MRASNLLDFLIRLFYYTHCKKETKKYKNQSYLTYILPITKKFQFSGKSYMKDKALARLTMQPEKLQTELSIRFLNFQHFQGFKNNFLSKVFLANYLSWTTLDKKSLNSDHSMTFLFRFAQRLTVGSRGRFGRNISA